MFWKNKKVFITGHTGFKGSWLSLWLHSMGARVTGYSLAPPTVPNLFETARVGEFVKTVTGDVRDASLLKKAMLESRPEIVIHMAAQPLVRESYKNPIETYSINVLGTVHFFEAIRACPDVKAVVNVTTDKCYENKGMVLGYHENDPLGGYDPYSNSKACSELVTASFRDSFFNLADYAQHGKGVSSARAGNVIGGGDWAADRLVPDCVRAFLSGKTVLVRNPRAVRPWQHVLEPLDGYLLLAQKLYENGRDYSEAWNFGPDETDAQPVEWIVKRMCEVWGKNASYRIDVGDHPHEAHYLRLDCSKAKSRLGWKPRWSLEKSLDMIVAWTLAYSQGKDVRESCLEQIMEYTHRRVMLDKA